MTEQIENQAPSPAPNHKRKKMFVWMATSIGVLALIVFLYWLFVMRYEEYTDDSYVTGNMVELTAQITGTVVTINADNTDFVKRGQVLLELDPTDYKIALEKSKNELAQAVRTVAQIFQNVDSLKEQVHMKEALLTKAKQDYENRVNLVGIGGVSKEEFEHVEADLLSVNSSLMATWHDLLGQEALIKGTTIKTHPLVEKAAEVYKEAWVNYSRCKVIAPVDGYIAMRTVQVGEWISTTKALLAVIPLEDIWVEANFKETQLSKMRIGQPVKVKSDIYGGEVTYRGKVFGIGAGTGSVFSIIPPQNATGNWIKIVQRVPVKIVIDPDQVENYPLRLGMSMKVTVDIHDRKGLMLAGSKKLKPLYKTTVYKKQVKGADQEIEEIIEANL